ncbi:GPW/gp25 family protein [Streptomyces canus]|uniref:GPW/gp25 family protein n=1 Tax=Streptomyces canus TaxID=58343 RepID=UPI0036C562FB
MDGDFIGTGWRFPIRPDAAHRLSYAQGARSVEDCLRVLLQTGLGERVMRPDLGTRIPELVFAPGSADALRLLESTVRDAVRVHEPRVELSEVRAEADPLEPFRVSVTVEYEIRHTNTRHNLVFPFYLAADGGLP